MNQETPQISPEKADRIAALRKQTTQAAQNYVAKVQALFPDATEEKLDDFWAASESLRSYNQAELDAAEIEGEQRQDAFNRLELQTLAEIELLEMLPEDDEALSLGRAVPEKLSKILDKLQADSSLPDEVGVLSSLPDFTGEKDQLIDNVSAKLLEIQAKAIEISQHMLIRSRNIVVAEGFGLLSQGLQELLGFSIPETRSGKFLSLVRDHLLSLLSQYVPAKVKELTKKGQAIYEAEFLKGWVADMYKLDNLKSSVTAEVKLFQTYDQDVFDKTAQEVARTVELYNNAVANLENISQKLEGLPRKPFISSIPGLKPLIGVAQVYFCVQVICLGGTYLSVPQFEDPERVTGIMIVLTNNRFAAPS